MKITLCTFLIAISSMAVAQFENADWGLGYTFSAPQNSMRQNMRQAHGGYLEYYVTPVNKRYSLGAEISVNGYGHQKKRETYTFNDGSTAPMDIVVTNTFFNLMLGGRYYLGQGNLQPFVTGKVGYSLYATRLNIYDPDDWDHCEPVETDLLKRDGTMIFGAGAGLRWDVLPNKNPGRIFMNLTINYTSGGRVDYMNVDAPSSAHKQPTQSSDVYAKFLNTQTQMIHEHHVGNVYTSLVELMDVRLGMTMKLM